jgi:hypothetical protein
MRPCWNIEMAKNAHQEARFYYISYISLKRAKRGAKTLKKILCQEYGSEIKLGHCQNIVARMLGYAHWGELHRVTHYECNEPSKLDSEISPLELEARLHFRASVLQECTGLSSEEALEITAFLGLSGQRAIVAGNFAGGNHRGHSE